MSRISYPDLLGPRLIETLLVIILLFPNRILSSNNSLLKGKHLMIVPTHLKGYTEARVNSSGYVIEINGSVAEMLSWLTIRYQFDYSFVPSVITWPMDDSPTQRGKLSFLENNEADLYIGAMVLTHQRFQQADFPMPWLWTSLGAVVPAPKTTNSLGNLFHPWKVQIWIGVILSLPIFILALIFLSKWLKEMVKLNNENPKDDGNITSDSIIKYVFGVFLSQGGNLRNNSLAIRLAAAVPQFAKPIIESIYDVVNVKNLMVVTDRGKGPDSLFRTAEFGVYKQFGTMLKNNPELRCITSEKCVEMVKSGSYVYVATEPFLDLAIQSDYKKDGVCHVMFLKERFLSSLLGFAVTKKSVYMEEISRGTLELMECGLVQYWDRKYVIPKKQVCHQVNHIRQPTSIIKSRLSLTNLSGPFVLLFIGYMLSFLVFLVEKIIYRFK